jgi:uncharacterized membrane protein YgcG
VQPENNTETDMEGPAVYRSVKIAAAAVAMTAILAGVTYAATRTVPENQAEVVLQNTTESPLPGNADALSTVLKAQSPVKYKILVIDSTEGEDKTDYLDRVAEKWGVPAADTLYLVIYTKDNYDIRFYMGANFRTQGVTVDEMLALVRQQYLAGKNQKGDVSAALANLINAVNVRMSSTPAPAPDKAPEKAPEKAPDKTVGDQASPKAAYTVPDPFGGARQSAAGQLEIAKGLMTQYFEHYKTDAVPETQRITEIRWNDNDINPVESTDTKIVYAIKFDLHTVAGFQSAWMIGTGQGNADGWIVGKTQFMTAVKEGNVWRLQGFSTNG